MAITGVMVKVLFPLLLLVLPKVREVKYDNNRCNGQGEFWRQFSAPFSAPNSDSAPNSPFLV